MSDSIRTSSTAGAVLADPSTQWQQRLLVLALVVLTAVGMTTAGLNLWAPGESSAASDIEVRLYSYLDDGDGSMNYSDERLADLSADIYINGDDTASNAAEAAWTGVVPQSKYDSLGVWPEETKIVVCAKLAVANHSLVDGFGDATSDPEDEDRVCRGATLDANAAAVGYLDASFLHAADAEVRAIVVLDENGDGAGSSSEERLAGVEIDLYLDGSSVSAGSVVTSATGVQPFSVFDVLGYGAQGTVVTQCAEPPANHSFVAVGGVSVTDPEGEGRECRRGTVSSGNVGGGSVLFFWTFEAVCEGVPVTMKVTPGQTLFGTVEPDVILGTPGDDVIYGRSGDDIICGGGGNDEIHGEGGRDRIFGQDGQDDLYGGDDNDVILGGDGNDNLFGEFGDDVLRGEDGFDTLRGADGNDTMFGGNDDDFMEGGDGNDVLKGQRGFDTLRGDGGRDVLRGGRNVDSMFGGDGDDELYGQTGNDVMYGEAGDDYLDGSNGGDDLYGGDGDDVLRGERNHDALFGGEGNDDLTGGSENDLLEGGSGNDELRGQAGFDELFGDDGDDLLWGGTEDDELDGGAGNDILRGDNQADDLKGGSGIDECHGNGGSPDTADATCEVITGVP